MGPVANMLSVAALVNSWRQTPEGKEIKDRTGIYVINATSLGIGCISNIILFMHFSNRLTYITSQLWNIFGWSIAMILLVADLLWCWNKEIRFTDKQKGIGFWYAFFTVILYAGCTATLSLHFLGYKLKKYAPKFNLSEDERTVMMYTLWLSCWFMWGAGMFSQIMNISYGSAVYYCVVSTTTVGLGDVTPQTVAAKIMTLIFFLSSLLILGLIVTLTRTIVQKSFRPIVSLHISESKRSIFLKDLANKNDHRAHDYRDYNQFLLMRKTHKECESYAKRSGAILSVVIWILFWLIGALIFKFIEDWSYFNALYFCFLCLITIGYGDFAPSTGAGRSFFVVWALAAVPLMTCLINSVGEYLYDLGWSLSGNLNKAIRLTYRKINKAVSALGSHFFRNLELILTTTQRTNSGENTSSSDEQIKIELAENLSESDRSGDDSNLLSNKQLKIEKKIERLWLLAKDYSLLSETEPDHKLLYQEWVSIFSLLPDKQFEVIFSKNFWLSNVSPIRYNTNESRLAFLQLSSALKLEMKKLFNQDGNYNALGALNRQNSSDFLEEHNIQNEA
ncbi:hypothetical protein ACO0RG_004502 [Hanseniaspora osmophila]